MKLKRIVADGVLILLTITIVPAAIFAVSAKASILMVTSKSMEPTIKALDTVITREIPRTQVKPEEIIILPVPDNPNLKYSHRVVKVEAVKAGTLVKTKGDGNPTEDSWTMRVTSDQIPKVIAVLPTAPIFNGPISRRTIFYTLFYTGILLFSLAIWRLARTHI